MRFNNFLNEANVANTYWIDKQIADFAYAAEVSNNSYIMKWMKSTVRKHLLNDLKLLVKIDKKEYENISNHEAHAYWDFLEGFDWENLTKSIEQGREVYLHIGYEQNVQDFFDTLVHILDYFKEINPQRDIRMSVDQAEAAANKFFKEKNKNASSAMNDNNIKVIKKYSDGSYWCWIKHQDEMQREGKLMKNCIGIVHKLEEKQNPYICSFRTKDNIPHISMYIENYSIHECKLNSNKYPDGKKYVDEIIDIINTLKIKSLSSDLRIFINDVYLINIETDKKWITKDQMKWQDLSFPIDNIEYKLSGNDIKKMVFNNKKISDTTNFKLKGSDGNIKTFDVGIVNITIAENAIDSNERLMRWRKSDDYIFRLFGLKSEIRVNPYYKNHRIFFVINKVEK